MKKDKLINILLLSIVTTLNEDPGRVGGYKQGDLALYEGENYWNFPQIKQKLRRFVETVNEYPYASSPQMKFLEKLVFTKAGRNGTREVFTFSASLFQKGGKWINPDATRESSWSWGFLMEEYTGKPVDISLLDAVQLEKNGGSIVPVFERQMTKLLQSYINIFLPNMLKSVLFNVPPAGGSYQDNFGLLRDVDVMPERLHNPDDTGTIPDGQPNSTVRNHYRAISNPVVGVMPSDVVLMKDYLKEYVDNTDFEVICLSSPAFLTSLRKNAYTYDRYVDDEMIKGQTGLVIEGVKIIPYEDYIIPNGFAIFLVDTSKSAKLDHNDALFYRLIHDNPKFQGIDIVVGESDKYWDDVRESDLKEVKLNIHDFGLYLVGRHRAIIVDAKDRGGAGTGDNIMVTAGINELLAFSDRSYSKCVTLG